MIARLRLRKKLLELGYSFSLRTKRVEIHRKKGSTKRIELTHHREFSEEYVRIVLRQAGLDQEEIERFIAENH